VGLTLRVGQDFLSGKTFGVYGILKISLARKIVLGQNKVETGHCSRPEKKGQTTSLTNSAFEFEYNHLPTSGVFYEQQTRDALEICLSESLLG
jgi:hypothetical protein